MLTCLCPALYCTFRTSSVFSHSVITLCRICPQFLTFGFICCNALIKWCWLFLMMVDPFTLIINWFSNRLKFGFSAFLPDQLGVFPPSSRLRLTSLIASKIVGLVWFKYSCSSIIWFASSSSVLLLLCFPPGISIFPYFSFICPGSSLCSSSVVTAWLIKRLNMILFLVVRKS